MEKRIPFTAKIEPSGATQERRFESLVLQLKQQNEQLQAIVAYLYKRIERLEK